MISHQDNRGGLFIRFFIVVSRPFRNSPLKRPSMNKEIQRI